MQAEHLELGKKGEELTASHYEKSGYRVMARNWRLKKLECDLIVSNAEFMVFVEVKTPTNLSFC